LILVDLNTLKTDSGSRDNYFKRNTLEVERFPNASFAPSKAEGMPSPLPASGEASFTMTGITTIHGVQKEVTWKVTAKRDGATITGKATATVTFGDFGMTIPRAAAVLSVKDEIRLEIDLSATAS
ncbi:MAG: YceI family protein, partial [Proteobacteria bacterium]|nr:YceI family protein [Pseudomonadota bacterium]